MKKFFKNVKLISAITVGLVLLAGCGKKLKTTNYEDEETHTSISFKYPEELECTYSTDSKDLRTTAENAIWIFDKYKIAVDILNIYSDEDFNKVKEKKSSNENYEDYTEVTFNKISGISYYYAPYNRYEVCMPINDKYYANFHIYSTKEGFKKEDAEEVFNSDEMREIFNTIEIKINQ
ncbi:MAG: hypothetical protein ACI4PR_05750 [Acutalibacteraceae bacterium]